jgi:hypothetical protein
MFTLLLPRDVSVAGNLEMADYDTGSDEELVETAVVAAAGLVMIEAINAERAKKRKRSRSVWVKPIFQRRGQIGAYNLLMMELRQANDDMFSGFTRMTPQVFDDLLNHVKGVITGSRRFRVPIEPELKLAVTLRYLATGMSNRCLIS